MRFLFFLPLCFALFLASCASVKERGRAGVAEAKACVKAVADKKMVLEKYKLHACTNNGVWIAVDTETGTRFDFLNKEFTTAENDVLNLSDLDSNARAEFLKTQRNINKELLDLY